MRERWGSKWGIPWGLLCGTSGMRKLCMVPCHICRIYGIWDLEEQRGGGCFKVSEYPIKENKNTFKNKQVLLYTHFYNISLNVLRPNFLNICNLPISHFPNIRKIRVKVEPKTNYFSYFMNSCTDSIVVFNNFFSLIFSQPRDKQNRARDFLLFKYFLNNLLGKKKCKTHY